MSKSSSRLTWLFIIGILIFSAALTAIWPTVADQLNIGGSAEAEVAAEPQVIVVDVEQFPAGDALIKVPFIRDNIHGLELTPLQLAGILVIFVVGGTVALGLPLALISRILSKQATNVLESESYQTAEAALANRQKEILKERQAAQPESPEREAGVRARWMLLSMTPLVLLFVWFSGLALGHAFFGDTHWTINGQVVNPIQFLNLTLILVTIIIIFIVARRIEPEAVVSGATDYRPVNWGMVWVVVSGLIIVGLGTGLAVALRSGA